MQIVWGSVCLSQTHTFSPHSRISDTARSWTLDYKETEGPSLGKCICGQTKVPKNMKKCRRTALMTALSIIYVQDQYRVEIHFWVVPVRCLDGQELQWRKIKWDLMAKAKSYSGHRSGSTVLKKLFASIRGAPS